jgi:hypothetical protein
MTVYVIQCEVTKNVKIGYTKGTAERRLRQLKTATSAPLSVVREYPQMGCKHEALLHKHFQDFHVVREWFSCRVLLTIDNVVSELDVSKVVEFSEAVPRVHKSHHNVSIASNPMLGKFGLQKKDGSHLNEYTVSSSLGGFSSLVMAVALNALMDRLQGNLLTAYEKIYGSDYRFIVQSRMIEQYNKYGILSLFMAFLHKDTIDCCPDWTVDLSTQERYAVINDLEIVKQSSEDSIVDASQIISKIQERFMYIKSTDRQPVK